MRSTILGMGEWRPATKRLNSDWSRERVDGWHARMRANAAAPSEPNADENALTGLPDLEAADRLSAVGFVQDLEDPFLFAQERYVADDRTTSAEAGAFAGALEEILFH